MYQTIRYEKNGNIGIATINRPEALNALNSTVISELEQLISEVEKDAKLGAFIITGEGRSFVAGADIGEQSTMDVAAGRKWGQRGSALFRRIEKLEIPTIAAVNGFALGGGCELALACDFRFASDNAKFGQPEVNYGIIPGFGGSQRLARLIGTGEAKEMIYTGSMIDAEEALRIGLINRITTQENLIPECEAILRKIMSKAPMAIASAKNAINTGMNMDLRSGLAYEAQVFGSCFATRDQKEGMAAFLEKRKPVFTNR